MIHKADIPVIPRGVRLHQDKVRDIWVLLAPERTITLDDIGLAILTRIDGKTTFDMLVADLARTYAAPAEQISGDVASFITGLADRRILDITA